MSRMALNTPIGQHRHRDAENDEVSLGGVGALKSLKSINNDGNSGLVRSFKTPARSKLGVLSNAQNRSKLGNLSNTPGINKGSVDLKANKNIVADELCFKKMTINKAATSIKKKAPALPIVLEEIENYHPTEMPTLEDMGASIGLFELDKENINAIPFDEQADKLLNDTMMDVDEFLDMF